MAETKRRSVRLDDELYELMKKAAQMWAQRTGLGSRGTLAAWQETVLRKAAEEEISRSE